MNKKVAGWTAWSIAVLFFLLSSTGLALQAVSRAPYVETGIPLMSILLGLVGIWIIIGALIVSRHPEHPVGWLLCAGMFTPAIDMLAAGYAAYDTYVAPGPLPGVGVALAWLKVGNLGPIGTMTFTLILLLFPDGKFLSTGWRKVSWLSIGALILFLPIQAFEPGPADPYFLPIRTNPIGTNPNLWSTVEPFYWAAYLFLVLCYEAGLLSLFIRHRRTAGEARRQAMYLLYPAGLFGVFLPMLVVGTLNADESFLGFSIALGQLAVAGMVIAIAFAVLKYRLYDFQIIISRTLIYSTLTGSLAGIYLFSVAMMQRLLPAESPLAIVISTLVIAGLFNPLRRRIQDGVDRVFYRRRYDARRVLDAFAEMARQEADLDRLVGDLLDVVDETLHPAALSILLPEVAGVLPHKVKNASKSEF